MEILAGGFTWLEGPIWNKQEGYLLFSDIPGNAVYKWHPRSGVSLFLKPSGYTGDKHFEGKEPGSNVVLTADSHHLLVQLNVEKAIGVYRIDNGKIVDTGERIQLSGGPTSIRTKPR